MMRLIFLLPSLLPLSFPLSCGRGGETPSNLLVITIDTLRRDAIGCYGNVDARTPRIDRLAAEGILLADAHCPIPLTLPSHSSLFTGRYPVTHGSRHNPMPLPEARTTLAERFAERGDVTAGFVGSPGSRHIPRPRTGFRYLRRRLGER